MATKRASAKKTTTRRRKLGKRKWSECVPEQADKSFRDYSSNTSFYEGDLVRHFKFGKGVVDTSFGNKIEVLFEDKKRLLIHKILF